MRCALKTRCNSLSMHCKYTVFGCHALGHNFNPLCLGINAMCFIVKPLWIALNALCCLSNRCGSLSMHCVVFCS